LAISSVFISIHRSHNETHWRLGSLGQKPLAEMQAIKLVHTSSSLTQRREKVSISKVWISFHHLHLPIRF